MYRILFAEDESILGALIKEALEREPEFDVFWCQNGLDALERVKTALPDLCILDVMMPLMDGFTVAREIRHFAQDVPILFLTARSQTADVLKGFEAGCNDYLRKPFSIEELIVRCKALLRQQRKVSQPILSRQYQIGRYVFSADTQSLTLADKTFQLSHKEFALLEQLALNKNALLDRKQALLLLWGEDSFFHARSMDVYISRLRKILAEDKTVSILNIRGYGYKLAVQPI